MDRPGREVMERVFGKRVMKEVDKIVAERSDDKDGKDEEPMP